MTSPLESCRVDVEPALVDAGAELTICATAGSPPATDGPEPRLEVVGEDDALVERLTRQSPVTWEARVAAPPRPGPHTWRVVHRSDASSSRSGESQTVGTCAFEVRPHETRVRVWDVPSAVTTGAAFTVTVGAKCPFACGLGGGAVEVTSPERGALATTVLGETPWPGTDGLLHARVPLQAPSTIGAQAWEARVQAPGDIPHATGVARFEVRVTPPPDHRLRVVAVDAVTQAPVEGARVVAHPFRGITDEHGVADLAVPAGTYRVFVTGRDYLPFRADEAVETDRTLNAELTVRRELTDADIWS